ncbi:aldehyde dehydrogenase family protein [Mesoterricola silvestris]|uniref:Aldehyde dehydrogenase n=1 Tax=Mesoterricola silvestris TaxID=2927979 RepID=A0AA48KA52_9BACT|nr:aldehyde dehydrogenase family protein [Mesoterricola silvestris]BDU73760.1 aldehyde dehydrogenase [Mesoterricola silvestris]
MEQRTLSTRTRVERRAEPPTYRQQVTRAVNPATFEVIGNVPQTPEGLVPTFVERARRAADAWGLAGWEERGRTLGKLRALIAARAQDIAATISRSMGKPLFEALHWDVAMVLEDLDDYLSHGERYLADEKVDLPARMERHKTALVRYAPRGVVCIISPWNFPFELAMAPAVAALAAGNAVILKPTSAAPLVGDFLERLFAEAFQDWPGLAQVIHGPGPVGTAVATAPGVDFVCFTGSTAVGRDLQARLAPLLRPCLLELGGSDPLIVCADANLERAANAAVHGRFANNGQVCAAVKRVYCHESVSRSFVEKVIAKVNLLKLGPWDNPTSDIGPLANDRAISALRSLLHDALDKGAKLVAGGFPAIQAGWYWQPTVITGVDHSMRIMKEETFGPILPICTVKDDEEALELANDNPYGLDAYVFTNDMRRAHRMANRLRAGSVNINDVGVNYAIRDLPFGGVKQSGHGRCHGRAGLRLFTDPKAMVIDDGATDTEPAWFPYDGAKLEQAKERCSGIQ